MRLLLGYGNPLRSDDGVGQVVVEEIAGDGQVTTVETIACHQLLPEHAEAISLAERVVFVDAAALSPPGEIAVQEVQPAMVDSGLHPHDITPQTLLAYAQILYGHTPSAMLITVNGFSFAHGDTLSPTMTALLPEILVRVRESLS